jgi:hypothetical protein
MPVATVSKSYSLIQHRDVLALVFRALKMIDIDISGVESLLLLSEYRERMQWSCPILNFDFDPGDGYPLVLRIDCLTYRKYKNRFHLYRGDVAGGDQSNREHKVSEKTRNEWSANAANVCA